MSSIAIKKKLELETVIQYWICVPVLPCEGLHVYIIEGEYYSVTSYCLSELEARELLGENLESGILEVEVPDYDPTQRVSHKKNFHVVGWLIRPNSKASG